MPIPYIIDNGEILVRFVFLDNFKNKKLESDKINSQEIFLDTRLLEVSLQRENFTNVKFCKERAKNIPNKTYVGFVIFYKKDFQNEYLEYKTERPNFESSIEYTPLNNENHYLINIFNCEIDNEGNPSHSDLFYINPAVLKDENPNTTLRLFSRKLYSRCKLILDRDIDSEELNGKSFYDLMN